MRSDALRLAKSAQGPTEAENLLREYVQARILGSLHESRAFESLSFVGGTALRFLYALPRFSEDLDFSLETPENYKPAQWLKKLKRDLEFQGFDVAITFNDKNIVQVAWVRIADLLFPASLAARREQKLAIKLEIDTNPPSGARLERKMVTRHLLFGIRHHDLSSLMAGKIRAMLTRPYAKGRDWFDLLWYASQIPPVEPNMALLSNALAQGSPVHESAIQASEWRGALAAKLDSLDFAALQADVSPFLERREDRVALNEITLRTMLRRSQPKWI